MTDSNDRGLCGFECMNLDDQPLDDLRRLALVLEILSAYAKARATAGEFRLAGSIEQARRIENVELPRLYGLLPEWARW